MSQSNRLCGSEGRRKTWRSIKICFSCQAPVLPLSSRAHLVGYRVVAKRSTTQGHRSPVRHSLLLSLVIGLNESIGKKLSARRIPVDTMDSLPQELIDAIINNLPRSSLRSSSLVARRWRTTSQQRNFVSITFRSQDNVYHWLSNVQSGQNKIVPYIRSAQFRNISSWNKPTLFCRALQGFCSLTTLSVYRSMIPDELLGHISRGEFGRGITALYLEYPQCELSTIISMILSLPDLRKLVAKSGGTTSSQQPSTSSVAPCRGPFDLLGLYYGANGIAEALIQSRIASRYICLGAAISSVHQLLALSSESLKVLMLEGLWFL